MARNSSGENQVVRCITLLLAMARSRRGINVRTFADQHGSRPRNVYRDIETLGAAGVPIETPEYGWHRVAADWLPPAAVDLLPDERMALHVARQLAPGLQGTALGHALTNLWNKLATPGRQLRLPIDDTWFHAGSPAPIDYTSYRVIIDTAHQAVRTRRALRIHYRKPDGSESERTVEPAAVRWDAASQALYLPTWCHAREAVRIFAIHRILRAELTDHSFARRPEVLAEMTTAFRLWPRPRTEHTVLRFAPQVAGEIRERHWHPTARLTDTDDGGVLLEMDIAAPEELERLLLGYGPDVVIEAPASLAERVRDRHAAAVAATRLGTLHARRPAAATAAVAEPPAVAPLRRARDKP